MSAGYLHAGVWRGLSEGGWGGQSRGFDSNNTAAMEQESFLVVQR